MKEAFKTVTAYRITVFYTDDTPTETYFKPTMAEAEAYKEELLQEDENIESIDISEDPEQIEALNLDGVPETNTDCIPELNLDEFPELDTDALNIEDSETIPAADSESID